MTDQVTIHLAMSDDWVLFRPLDSKYQSKRTYLSSPGYPSSHSETAYIYYLFNFNFPGVFVLQFI